MVSVKKISFFLMLLALIFGSCKKEGVVLEDPGKYSRTPSLPLALYDISFVPFDIFNEANSEDFTINADSSVNFLLVQAFNLNWEFELNFDIQSLIGGEGVKESIENFNIFADFTNGMPFSVDIQIYAVNDTGIVDSLVRDDLRHWESPGVNNSGVVAEPVINKIPISFNFNEIDKLYNERVTKLIVKTLISSEELYQQPDVPNTIVLPNSTLIGMKFSIHLNKGVNTK